MSRKNPIEGALDAIFGTPCRPAGSSDSELVGAVEGHRRALETSVNDALRPHVQGGQILRAVPYPFTVAFSNPTGAVNSKVVVTEAQGYGFTINQLRPLFDDSSDDFAPSDTPLRLVITGADGRETSLDIFPDCYVPWVPGFKKIEAIRVDSTQGTSNAAKGLWYLTVNPTREHAPVLGERAFSLKEFPVPVGGDGLGLDRLISHAVQTVGAGAFNVPSVNDPGISGENLGALAVTAEFLAPVLGNITAGAIRLYWRYTSSGEWFKTNLVATLPTGRAYAAAIFEIAHKMGFYHPACEGVTSSAGDVQLAVASYGKV
jgi:hypothetical protein